MAPLRVDFDFSFLASLKNSFSALTRYVEMQRSPVEFLVDRFYRREESGVSSVTDSWIERSYLQITDK